MKASSDSRRYRLALLAAATFACLVALPALLCRDAPAQQPADADVIAAIKDFSRSTDARGWLDAHRSRLTPEFLTAAQRLSDEAARQGQQRGNAGDLHFAQLAKLLVANVLLEQGDRPNALRVYIGATDVGFLLADSTDAYAGVRQSARDSAAKAAGVGAGELAFRAQVIAADASYQGSILQGLDVKTRDQWEHDTLVDLLAATKLADSSQRGWFERFVSLSGAALNQAYTHYGYGGNESDKVTSLKQLTLLLQTLVPPDFSFRVRPDKDWTSDVGLAQVLASLSYDYGDAGIGAGRLRYAAAVARSHGDADGVASSISQLYESEKRRRASPAQLSALRAEVQKAAAPLRAGYRSRGGRLWAAARSDTLLGQLTRDDLAAGAGSADAFGEIEALKARLLLDQLSLRPVPLRAFGDIKTAAAIEHELLGFPACSHSHGDMLTRELLLLSRMSLASGFTQQDDDRRVNQVEQIYQAENAGFSGVASPPSLAAVQAALKADEAIVEYFIPYYELHPAIDLWVVAITASRTAIVHVPLDSLLPKAGMIGSIAADNCPPLDASPLGNAVAKLRVALQSTDEKESGKLLRFFHHMLIEPVVKAGFDPTKFQRWIIVPHGPLHYVPFAALTDANGTFLIRQVALSTSPSAAVWLRQQSVRRSQPRRVAGLFAPVLSDPSLPRLPPSEGERSAILERFPASSDLMFAGPQANRRNLRLIAPNADILHFSTHGDFPELYSMDQHAVLLSQDGADNGRLSAEDIRALDLSHTGLVILVVCNGGLYNVGPSDEPYGLMPAFLVAGATNVLGTLWPVEDDFGRRFVARFYQDVAAVGPAQALRRTMLSFIDDGELIRRWSGLVILGPGRS